MKKLLAVLMVILFCLPLLGIEIVRQRGVATRIVVPIIDADGDIVTGATALDSEIDHWTNSTNPTGFADCTNEATEIGTTGIYYLSLTAAELDSPYVYIQVKTTSTGAKTQHILIRTMTGDPLFMATNQSGRTLDVTATGEAGIDWANIGSPGTAQDLSGTGISIVNTATNLTTNNDKTGYALTNAQLGLIADSVSLHRYNRSADTDSMLGRLIFRTDSLAVANLNATVGSRSTLTTTDNIGINWGDVSNPTSTVDLTNTTIQRSDTVLYVADFRNNDTTFSSNAGGEVWTTAQRDSIIKEVEKVRDTSNAILAEVVNIDAWNPITDNESLIVDQSTIVKTGYRLSATGLADFDSAGFKSQSYQPPNQIFNGDFESEGALTDATPEGWLLAYATGTATRGVSATGKMTGNYAGYVRTVSGTSDSASLVSDTFKVFDRHILHWGFNATTSAVATYKAYLVRGGTFAESITVPNSVTTQFHDTVWNENVQNTVTYYQIQFKIKGGGSPDGSHTFAFDNVYAFVKYDSTNQVGSGETWSAAQRDSVINRTKTLQNLLVAKKGMADGGTHTTTKFISSNLTEADDYWNDNYVVFFTGNAKGQPVYVKDFFSTGDSVQNDPAFTTAPITGDSFFLFTLGALGPTIAQLVDSIYEEPKAGHTTAGTYGKYIDTTITSRGTSTLSAVDNIGINWADVINPSATLDLVNTTIQRADTVLYVADFRNNDTTFASNAGGADTAAIKTMMTNNRFARHRTAPGNPNDTVNAVGSFSLATASVVEIADTLTLNTRRGVMQRYQNDASDSGYMKNPTIGTSLDSTTIQRIIDNAFKGRGLYKLTITTRDSANAVNIGMVMVQAKKSGTDNWISGKISSSTNGQVVIDVDTGTVVIRGFASSYTFTSINAGTDTVQITGNRTDTMWFSKYDPGNPTLSGLQCRVFGCEYTIQGLPQHNAIITATPVFDDDSVIVFNDTVSQSGVFVRISELSVSARANEDGQWFIDLYRSRVMFPDRNYQYAIEAKIGGQVRWRWQGQIPNSTQYRLK